MTTHEDNMESFSRGSDEDYSLVCLPCHRDDTTIPAYGYCVDCQEHLCQACYKHHRKAKPSRHHKLQDKDTMPSTQQLTDTSVHGGTTDELTTPCPRHKTEMIKLYCHDHDLLLCSICVALEHTKPCHVHYIPEISDNMIDSRDYKDTIKRADRLLKKCVTIKTEQFRDTNQANDSLKNALLEIEMYRQEINKRIDELQKEIETRIQVLQHENDEHMKTLETICDDVKKIVKVMYDNMKQLHTSKQAIQLFMEVKQAQKQLQDYEGSISSISAEDTIDEYKFIPNQTIMDVLQKEKNMGDIFSKQQTKTDSSSQLNLSATSAYDDITPTCLGEICVKTSQDGSRCRIFGMTILPPDRLVLTDFHNNSIKLVDVNNKSSTSHLSLGGKDKDTPWDITSTTSTQVAVTVPRRQRIQFISVSDRLIKSHTIQTDGDCVGICCYQNKLFVTYWYPGKLEILDMKGRVITSVTTYSSGEDVFSQPTYVQANSNSIYVSDIELTDVILLNWNGEITGRITDCVRPAGLASLADRCLIVCDGGGNRVCQASGDCTNTRTLLQDLLYPCALCVDEEGHKLYISRASEDDDDQIANSILVYNI